MDLSYSLSCCLFVVTNHVPCLLEARSQPWYVCGGGSGPFFFGILFLLHCVLLYVCRLCIKLSGRGGSRGGSLGSDEPPLLLTALKNKAY